MKLRAAFYSEDATNHQMAEAPVSGRAAIRQRFATEFHVVEGRIFQRGYWDKLSFLRMHGLPLPKDP